MKEAKAKCGKVSVCNLGTALGVTWGLSLFALVGLSMSAGAGTQILRDLTHLYPGYHASFSGALIGLAWGFVHGFVTGMVMATVYNYCRCKCPCSDCKNDRCST
jgi:hypothetical protein